MKKYLLLFVIVVMAATSNAQCPTATPGYLSGTMSNILATDTTALPVYSVTPTGLPNTEFILIKKNQMADDGFGPVVLGADSAGRVVPADYGLTTCDELCLVPFSFDLAQLKTVVDTLFGGYYVYPIQTCCVAAQLFIPGICDSLTASGISSGNDVNDLSDVLTVMSLFSGAGTGGLTYSLQSLILTIDGLNSSLSLFGGCSGGITELCYEVADTLPAMDCYRVVLPNSATAVSITQSNVVLAPSGSIQLTAMTVPNLALDTVMWSISGTSSIAVDPMTGVVTAGAIADSVWVVAMGIRGCAKDSVWVVVDPALGLNALSKQEIRLQAYPNPFDQNIQVQFFAQAGNYQWELIDARGQVVKQQNSYLNEGAQTLQISTNELPVGYYLIRLIGDKLQGTKAIVKK